MTELFAAMLSSVLITVVDIPAKSLYASELQYLTYQYASCMVEAKSASMYPDVQKLHKVKRRFAKRTEAVSVARTITVTVQLKVPPSCVLLTEEEEDVKRKDALKARKDEQHDARAMVAVVDVNLKIVTNQRKDRPTFAKLMGEENGV